MKKINEFKAYLDKNAVRPLAVAGRDAQPQPIVVEEVAVPEAIQDAVDEDNAFTYWSDTTDYSSEGVGQL